MVEIDKLRFGYKKKRTLFKDLSLKLEKGKIYGLLGLNGAGKTTLLKHLTAVLYPQSGSVKIDSLDSRKRQAEYLQKYYFVPEEFELNGVTIEKFIKIYSPFYPKFSEEQFYQYLKDFSITDTGKITELSYGQKKKFLLSFGLATNSPLLITDEPTNGLDIPSKSIFRKIMAAAITDDRIFIISTHQVRDIENLIDSIIILHNGKIIFNSEINEVLAKYKFITTDNTQENEKVIYSENILGGIRAIVKDENAESIRPDIELLFNAVIANPENFK